jgi:hypothetical protein
VADALSRRVHELHAFCHKDKPRVQISRAHQQNPNYHPFQNTCEADGVSPEVEAGMVVGLGCLQP